MTRFNQRWPGFPDSQTVRNAAFAVLLHCGLLRLLLCAAQLASQLGHLACGLSSGKPYTVWVVVLWFPFQKITATPVQKEKDNATKEKLCQIAGFRKGGFMSLSGLGAKLWAHQSRGERVCSLGRLCCPRFGGTVLTTVLKFASKHHCSKDTGH